MNGKTVFNAVMDCGGWAATGRICKVSPQAVRRWADANKMPSSELSGETSYSDQIATELVRIRPTTDKEVIKQKLINTAKVRRKVKRVNRMGRPQYE